MKRYRFDFIVIIIFIVIALISGLAVNLKRKSGEGSVEIISDTEVIRVLSLAEDGEYPIKNGEDLNIIKISGGCVWVESANCPDELCVRQGKISKNGQSVICLPHRLVIRIVSDKENKADAKTN